jgi:hypothetical protein
VAVQPARASEVCATQQPVFAVAAATGHLVEVPWCGSQAGFGLPVEVDDGDWRGFRQLFAARSATAVVLYSIAADGAMSARRQDARGAGFGPPVRVGGSVDWSRYDSVFVAQPGYVQAVEHRGPIQTFQHLGWSTGGTTVAKKNPLLARTVGPSMTAAAWGGFGEAVAAGKHYRIWRTLLYPTRYDHDDAWYTSGHLPPDVTAAAGSEAGLYGVDSAGDLVRLAQDVVFDCPLANLQPWYVAARSPGGYVRVVAPAERSAATTPTILPIPPRERTHNCPPIPVEWQ